jgi:hypothetical protein
MVAFGMNCVMLMEIWCPEEDSNFHDLAATGT